MTARSGTTRWGQQHVYTVGQREVYILTFDSVCLLTTSRCSHAKNRTDGRDINFIEFIEYAHPRRSVVTDEDVSQPPISHAVSPARVKKVWSCALGVSTSRVLRRT
jgi:hypothetical protein